MISARKIRELFQISADNPELVRAQFGMFTSQVPLLYFMLLVNGAAISYTHFETTPRILTIYGPGLLGLFCVVRLYIWVSIGKRKFSTDQVVRRLKNTVVLAGVVALLFLIWGACLLHYGDAYAQGHTAFFLAITAIGCIFCLMHVRPAALVLTIVGIVPASAIFMSLGRPTFVAMGIDWALVSVAMVYIVLTHSRDFANMINLQKELAKKHLETLHLAEENSRLANVDVLTDLPNRRQFFTNLHELLRLAARDDKRFVVGVIDLDGFKSVNDFYGHVTGDQLLVEAGRRLKDIADESVSLARLGGDEFGVVIDGDLCEEQINVYGERICAALRAPFLLSNATAQIACSIGFATYPEAATTAELLFERADYALYHVKQHARGRSVIFSREHEIQIRQFASVENCLHNADLEQELSLNFQPIYDVVRGDVVAFEALARWDSPKLGRVPPDVFIPVAERTNFVSQLTQILLRKALAHVRAWPDDIRISFNLSARDVGSAEAILKIIATIESSGVIPERIDLEVTETALIHDFDKGCECLKALKALGVRIALDDFGSGYSSLSYVHRLPLDKIKIDRSFIKDVETQGNSRDIVKTIIGLCQNLKLECIIEGMETNEQVQVLRGLGGEMMQGYYFGKPMLAGAVPGFLAAAARARPNRAMASVSG
ncbi:MAG: putative bifunctional diguanylate cyclase/phosphodiesterase [Roseiarcus sp.]